MDKTGGAPKPMLLHEIITDEIIPSDDFSLDERCARIQQGWIASRPKDWNKSDMSKMPTIQIHFQPDEAKKPFISRLLGRRHKGTQWRAIMRIWTCNTPRLMREGFCWGPDDVNEANGYTQLNDKVSARAWGLSRRWKHVRVYELQPLGDKVEWLGHMLVFAQEATALAQFELNFITPERAVKMTATNWQKRLVYLADRRRPDISFNTIYGSMPLKGWWIWPKAKSSISERTTAASGSDMALEGPRNIPATGPSGITQRYIMIVCIDRDSQAPKPYSKADTKGEGDMEETIEIVHFL